ncbi:MAG: ABC transporter ATP-binding protein/permease [Rikenellaceae bacterium]|nr:ABC transporter ATP-binding protein/permease [Rikenellaceae bacterium]
MEEENIIKPASRPRAGRKTLFRMLSYMVSDRTLLIIVTILLLIGIVSNLLGSYMLRPIINKYIIPGDIAGLLQSLALLGGIYLAGVVAVFFQNRILNKISQRTVTRMRYDLFTKMENLPLNYFDTHKHGDLMSRYTNDIDRISDALTDSLASLFSSVLTLAGIFILMMYISPILTVIAVITVPVMLLTARYVVKRSRKYFTAQQSSLGELNGYVEEMMSGQKVIKIFGRENIVESEFGEINEDLSNKSEKAQYYSGLMMPLMQNLSTLNYVITTIVGSILCIFRGFDVGGLAAFLQYSRQFGRPINELANLYNNIQAAIAGAERIFQVIDVEPEPRDSPNAVTLTDIKGDVEMKDVFFSYEPGELILKGISFHAYPGCKIALVGTTGAGKTTIMNLIPRFYYVDSGEVLIDGIDVRNIERNNLRSSMAIVLQDTHLFTGTVMENIRLGNLNATDEEVIKAAKLTAAHSFIRRLTHGYNTVLENDGANLSQGQRQLLNIARAAVADPPILLLDEATSNIDTRSEILIQQGLDQLMQGRTSLIIAHRLSTIKNADEILVLEYGQVIEHGCHEELLAQKGKYYSLYKEQFE